MKLTLPLTLLALAAPALSKSCSSKDITTALKGATTAAKSTAKTAASLNIAKIQSEATELTNSQRLETQKLNDILDCNLTTLTASEQKEVCGSYKALLVQQEEAQKAVLDKAKLLGAAPFLQPVASVGTLIERGVNTLSTNVKEAIPACSKDLASTEKKALDAITQTVNDLHL